MLKKILPIIVLVFSLVVNPILAQESTPANTPVPTTITPPRSPAAPSVVMVCPEVTDHGANETGRHKFTLKTTSVPTETSAGEVKVYVLSGLETPNGILLTTGNSNTDATYGFATREQVQSGTDALSVMKSTYNYNIVYHGFTNPTRADSNGVVNVDVTPQTQNEESHVFFMMWETPTTTTGGDGSTNEDTSNTSGLEYTSFKFQGEMPQCQTFRADPFGRIYNKDLKPVPGAVVSLYNFNTQSLYTLPGLPNPVTTLEDGQFNFNIEPSTTFLRTNYTNLLDVHPNYKFAYTTPYAYGDAIVEQLGKQEQRDIAITGGSTPVLKLMSYGHINVGTKTKIDGAASWPLTFAEIWQGTQMVASQQSNKFGYFNFLIKNTQLKADQQITVKLIEADLLNNPKGQVANGKSVSKTIDPIPQYLEGIAYDSAGKVIPNAVVRVRLEISDAVYYQTRADANGFFQIKKSFLPIIPFYLDFIKPIGGTEASGTSGVGGSGTGSIGSAPAGNVKGNQVTIPEFAQTNKDYLEQNAINIMEGTKNGVLIDPGAYGSDNAKGNRTPDYSGASRYNPFKGLLTPDEAQTVAEQQRQRTIMSLIVLLILLISLVIGIVVYLKRRVVLIDKNGMKTYERDDK